MDINYTSSYTCSICKDHPDVVIFDGVTMGTVKNLPQPSIELDTSQILPKVPQTIRIFIPSKKHRKAIADYLYNGLSTTAFQEMVLSIGGNALTEYILQSSIVVCGNTVIASDERIKEVIYYFSSNQPIPGVFQFSMLEHD